MQLFTLKSGPSFPRLLGELRVVRLGVRAVIERGVKKATAFEEQLLVRRLNVQRHLREDHLGRDRRAVGPGDERNREPTREPRAHFRRTNEAAVVERLWREAALSHLVAEGVRVIRLRAFTDGRGVLAVEPREEHAELEVKDVADTHLAAVACVARHRLLEHAR